MHEERDMTATTRPLHFTLIVALLAGLIASASIWTVADSSPLPGSERDAGLSLQQGEDAFLQA
jgi:hypothetical protein